jgi:undecaprenyl diphosphate synthase
MEEESQGPEHIAIIPDGNRRWAKLHGKSIVEAYDIGIRKFGDLAKWAKESGVKTFTAWGFSTENMKRDDEEKKIIWKHFAYFLSEGIKRFKTEKREEFSQVRINFLGRLDLLPKAVSDLMREAMALTRDNKPYTVNFMIMYGGKAELVDAVNRAMASGKKQITEEDISLNLYTAGQKDPDLIIRTSGEQRTSGLMPWQSCYSELIFIDKLWPDIAKGDFEKCIEEYKKRKRRFGK